MRHFAIAAAAGLLFSAGTELTTTYTPERTLRIEATTTISMETTDSSIIRDGEPMEGGMGGGGGSEEVTKIVQLDTVLESKDGAPVKVKRVYETVEGSSTRTFGEQSMDSERESPFSGIELELTLDDGDVVVEVTDGDEPDEELLVGHRLGLALDALLPDGEIDVDDTWELEPEALQQVLGIDLTTILFPRQAPEDQGGRGEGERGGGRGRGMRGGGGSSTGALFKSEDWETEAKLVSIDEETEFGVVAVIEFTASCSGDMPERERGGGRGGRGGGDGGGFSLAPDASLATLRENTFEIELDGKLLFSMAEGRPVSLEVEATMVLESHTVRSRGESEIEINRTQEGTFTYVVEVSVEADDTEGDDDK